MANTNYFKYRYGKNIEFTLKEKSHLSIVGNSNDFVIDTLLNGNEKCNIFIGNKELNDDNIPTIRKMMSFVLSNICR